MLALANGVLAGAQTTGTTARNASALFTLPVGAFEDRPVPALVYRVTEDGWFLYIDGVARIRLPAAFAVTRQRRELLHDGKLRRMLLVLFTAAFFCAAIAGFFGAFINKAAPIR